MRIPAPDALGRPQSQTVMLGTFVRECVIQTLGFDQTVKACQMISRACALRCAASAMSMVRGLG